MNTLLSGDLVISKIQRCHSLLTGEGFTTTRLQYWSSFDRLYRLRRRLILLALRNGYSIKRICASLNVDVTTFSW